MWAKGTVLALPGQTEPWGTVVYSGALGYLVQLIEPPYSPVGADTYWFERDALADYALLGLGKMPRVQIARADRDWRDEDWTQW